jgi:hypothetical protein
MGATPGQHYLFNGTLTNGSSYSTIPPFSVLAQGDLAPTIIGGFAKWAIISRPQRVGMTVLDGYDPIIMSVPVMFDAITGGTGKAVERDIQILEWMGGRGKLYASDGHVGAPAQGDSPLVTVASIDGQGRQTSLIPPNCQDINWIVTGIDYDTGPKRNTLGERIRQLATITLTQHEAAPGTSFDSASVRAKARAANPGYIYLKVTAQNNTIRKIMSFEAHNPQLSAAQTVVKLNKTRLKLGPSVDADLFKHLKPGATVKVPKNLTNPKTR